MESLSRKANEYNQLWGLKTPAVFPLYHSKRDVFPLYKWVQRWGSPPFPQTMLETEFCRVLCGYWESFETKIPGREAGYKVATKESFTVVLWINFAKFPDPSKTFPPLVGLPQVRQPAHSAALFWVRSHCEQSIVNDQLYLPPWKLLCSVCWYFTRS